MTQRITFSIICLLTLIGCSHPHHDSRLSSIAAIVSDSPEDARRTLDSIDRNTLTEYDRPYYDFLTIKANDNANIEHTSDSLYLTVLGYYSRNTDAEIYPEVLYYGGRVYNDIGDLPTAIKYLRMSLEEQPEDTPDKKLRAKTLSLTGQLLDNLLLYDEAVPYVKEAIMINHNINDLTDEIDNLQLLGLIYMKNNNYSEAEHYFREAFYKSRSLDNTFRAKSSMYVGELKRRKGETDSALIYIRNTPENVNQQTKSTALTYATDIYYAAGLIDSAYIYAQELIKSDDYIDKMEGYHKILSSDMRNLLHPDSISPYLGEYLTYNSLALDKNQHLLELNQQSHLNYEHHQQLKDAAEKASTSLTNSVVMTVLAIMLLAIITLYIISRNKRRIIELHTALEYTGYLQQQLGTPPEPETDSQNRVLVYDGTETVSDLRERLRKRLYNIYSNSPQPVTPSNLIIDQKPYLKLKKQISRKKPLSSSDPLWEELKAMILEISPNFIFNLKLLTGGNINSHDLHTALLIKCGVAPSDMTILLNRKKSTIASRRESLCYRVFDKQLGTKVIDGIIR
ncbi:MAG: hypothetical protein K2M05_05915, partial [Paramuribaculum sp.]|nr:hypothetical protein [Paramuribaculum sp.]